MTAQTGIVAFGSSMFPFVPSGSELTLRRAVIEAIRVGDIVAYPAHCAGQAQMQMVAHRVIALEGASTSLMFVIRGDSQERVERVPAAAVAFVVTRVVHAHFEYATESLVGRTLARWAVQRGFLWRWSNAFLRGLVSRTASQSTEPHGVVAAEPDQVPATIEPRDAQMVRLASNVPSLIPPELESARDSLLRGLKHELRTPLNAILGFADLLLGELDGPLDPEERENVSVVREAGWNLLGSTNEVLDLATALMAPGEPVYEETDVAALLEELRRDLEQRCGMRPVHVRVEIVSDALEVRLERRVLSRVLRALSDVALSVTSAGEIAFGAELDPARGLQLWIAADGFGHSTAANARDLRVFALGEPRGLDRTLRVAGMQLSIVQRLLARQGAPLHVLRRAEREVLSIVLPVASAEAGPRPDAACPGDDAAEVTLALSYIAAMGHDLRTPLNAILGFADLLALDEHRHWSTAQRRSLEIVRERAIDLGALVDDMIDWAKLEAGELELARRKQPLLPLIEEALQGARRRSGSRGLGVELQAEPEVGELWVDGPRCIQALLGLLDHAIRSNPGPTVSVRVQRTAANVQLEIFDPGLEIRAEDQPAVFDAFRPSHAPTGQRIAGLQLGPAVARSLFRAHGGDVWFESRPGRGTTFTATLPEVPGPA